MMDNFTPEIVKSMSRKIDMLRNIENLSLRDLSKKSGVSKSQLYDIISGNKIPNIYTLCVFISSVWSCALMSAFVSYNTFS